MIGFPSADDQNCGRRTRTKTTNTERHQANRTKTHQGAQVQKKMHLEPRSNSSRQGHIVQNLCLERTAQRWTCVSKLCCRRTPGPEVMGHWLWPSDNLEDMSQKTIEHPNVSRKFWLRQSLCRCFFLCGLGSWPMGWAAVPVVFGQFLLVGCEAARGLTSF